MNTFNSPQEKIDFLKKYKLMSKEASDLPNYYYFKSTNDTPVACEVIGYDQIFDDWAVITIKANDEIINIHSGYLLEMKRKGTTFYKSTPSTPDNKDSVNGYIDFKHEAIETFEEKLQSLLENTVKELELPDNSLIIQANGGKKKKTASVYINEPPFPATKEELKKGIHHTKYIEL